MLKGHKYRPQQSNFLASRNFQHTLDPRRVERYKKMDEIARPLPFRLEWGLSLSALARNYHVKSHIGASQGEILLEKRMIPHLILLGLFSANHLPDTEIVDDLQRAHWYCSTARLLLEFGHRFSPERVKDHGENRLYNVIGLGSHFSHKTTHFYPMLKAQESGWLFTTIPITSIAQQSQTETLFLAWTE